MTDYEYNSENYHYNGVRSQNGVVNYSVNNSFSVSWLDGKDGTKVPNWRWKIMNGQNATSYFSAFETVRTRVPLALQMRLKGPQGPSSTESFFLTYTDDQGQFTPDDPSFLGTTTADIAAREQFVKKYRARRNAFQGGVFVGELDEVVRMIKSPVRALREEIAVQRIVAKKQRSKFRSPRAAVRAVADSWLEFAFGVKPLVNDAADAISLLDASPTRWREKINAQYTQQWHIEPLRVGSSAPGGLSWPFFTYVVGRSSEVSVRYLGAADAERQQVPSFAEQAGFSWSNVLPTAYELIPYSFLIDYFSNVGKIIEGISTGNISLSWGCRTERKINSVTVTGQSDDAFMKAILGPDYDWSASVVGSGKAGHRKTVIRGSIDNVYLGLSDFHFKVPGAQSTKWLNIAGLVIMRDADKRLLRI